MLDFNAYQYDALGEMTAVTQSGGPVSGKQANFAYNADGQVTEIDRYASINGSSPVAASTYVYNLANQLISLTHDANGTTINAYTYAYNADGRLTAMTSIDGSIAYAYDHDGQLTSSSGTGLPTGESDSYDAGGNRTNTGDSTAANNQLASDGTYDYAYDADGNLITQTTIATGATKNFTWDYRNRLTDVVYKTASGTITERIHYTYDAFNRRISQSIDPTGSGTYSQVEYYAYDGSNVLMTFDGTGSPTHVFLNGPAANMTLADDAGGGGNVSWMLADQQGTVRDVIDSSGNLLDHIQYDSYGNILGQTNPSNQPRFGYAGMILDSSTGLYYDNARFYDPRQGRFISQDPSGFGGGNTNLYGYVNNDPTNFTDPAGLSPKGTLGGGVDFGWGPVFRDSLFRDHAGGSGSDFGGGPELIFIDPSSYRNDLLNKFAAASRAYQQRIAASDAEIKAWMAANYSPNQTNAFSGPPILPADMQNRADQAQAAYDALEAQYNKTGVGYDYWTGKTTSLARLGQQYLTVAEMDPPSVRSDPAFLGLTTLGAGGFLKGGEAILEGIGGGAAESAGNGVTLFHGTDASSAAGILNNGLDVEQATSLGGGDAFWSTTSLDDANIFAEANPAGGAPSVIQMQVPQPLIDSLTENGLLNIDGPVHEFAPGAWDQLNEFATFSPVK